MAFKRRKFNRGRLVEHIDGRTGMMYDRNQNTTFMKQDKVVIQFFEEDGSLSKVKKLVKSEKLKMTGFVD